MSVVSPTTDVADLDSLDSSQTSEERDRVILSGMMVLATLFLLICSTFRHFVLRSGAFDLGVFDQSVWMISHGITPVPSLLGFHILSDHASLILYPVSLLYLIWSDPRMLLVLQAIALSSAAWPLWRIARGAGLKSEQALAVAFAYLAFPVVLTSNLFDFHPEALAIPAMFMAVLAARENRPVAFCISLAVILSCKEILSLTVAAMGFWLIFFENRRLLGTIALVAGLGWFVVALKVIIPYFGEGRNPSGMQHFAHLGTTLGQIIVTMVFHPVTVLKFIATKSTARYLILLLVPLAWGLKPRSAAPLLVAIPTLLLNLLSDRDELRSIFYQYSLPMVPFMFIAAVASVATGIALLQRGRLIVIWGCTLLMLGLFARVAKSSSQPGTNWDNMRETKLALAAIPPDARVLTSFEAVPHLSERELINCYGGWVEIESPDAYDAILINLTHPSVQSNIDKVGPMIETLRKRPDFELKEHGENILLFTRIDPTAASASRIRLAERTDNAPADIDD